MADALEPGAVLARFVVSRVETLPGIRAQVVEARHVGTGARLLHIAAADSENLFAVGFGTPPPDDSGVAHILEHAVLNGSRRFPVKDPFMEMLKSSMATFINAATYPDRTVFPVASNVQRDFFNLVDVYLDAVFHPLLTRHAFAQEGWHWDVPAPDETGPGIDMKAQAAESSLKIGGIVFNEMRGSFSDIDTVVEREGLAHLFPRGTYGLESGGEPQCIPDLTFSRCRRYYRDHYRPGNAHIFAYGNIPLAQILTFLDARLGQHAGPQGPPPTIILEPRWRRPRCATVPLGCPASDGDEGEIFTLNWCVGTGLDPMVDLAWEVVDVLLLGDDASPLRQALMESGMATDLVPSCGYSGDGLQKTFHVGVKGCKADAGAPFEACVANVLEECADKGFPTDRVRDAQRQLEYSHRDVDSGYPLALMDDVFSVWMQGGDPMGSLKLHDQLAALQQRIATDPDMLKRLIRNGLIDNPHRVSLRLTPGAAGGDHRERQLDERIRAFRTGLTPESQATAARRSAALKRRQNAPNSPRHLASLPRLRRRDIPTEPEPVPTRVTSHGNGGTLLLNDVFTNGINYARIAVDLGSLPSDLLPFVPIYAALLTRLGTRQRSHTDMAEAMTTCTGHLVARVDLIPSVVDPTRISPLLMINLKALDDTLEEALQLVTELVCELDLSDVKRLRTVMNQRRAQLLSAVVPRGHQFASLQAASHRTGVAHINNLWHGIPQLRTTHRLAHAMKRCKTGIPPELQGLCSWLQQRPPSIVSFTGSTRGERIMSRWLDQSSKTDPQCGMAIPIACVPAPGGSIEGIVGDMDVGHVAACLPAPSLASPLAPLAGVLAQLLSYDYLWEEIRAKGGAYGAFCTYEAAAECLTFASYRDPDVGHTVSVFEKIGQHIENTRWSLEAVEQAVIACVREDHTPIRPGMATGLALSRHVAGITQEWRRMWRQRLLTASPASVRELACATAGSQAIRQMHCAILAGRDSLVAAQAHVSLPMVVTPLL